MIRELSGPELSLLEDALRRLHKASRLPAMAMEELVIELPDGEVVDAAVAERVADAVMKRVQAKGGRS